MRPPSIDCWDTDSSKGVFSNCDWLQVVRSNAQSVPAEVIENQPSRDRPDGDLVCESVSTHPAAGLTLAMGYLKVAVARAGARSQP